MKHKKMLRFYVAVFMVFVLLISMAQPAFAEEVDKAVSESTDPIEDAGFSAYSYLILNNGDIVLTDYNGFSTELTFPSSIDGHKVVAVQGITLPAGVLSLTIPGSIKKVDGIMGDTLIRVTMNEGVEEIGEYAFGYYTSGLSTHPCNTALIEVNLPSTLKKIGESAFEGCYNLQKINFPEDCEICEKAFYRCGKLPCPDISIINKAAAYAFYGTVGYDEYGGISYKENGCTIVGGRLTSCYSNERVLEIPEGVEYIDFDFYDSRNDNTAGHYFEEVILPSTIKKVSGFDNCSELKKVTFNGVPESITSFCNCPNLSEITFPEGTKEITGFTECPLLTNISFPASVEKISGFSENENLEKVAFHEGSLKVIDEDSFSQCPKLDNILLPYGLEEIGHYAFSYCTSLKNITFPDTLYRVYYNFENEPWYYEQPLGEPIYIGSCFMGFRKDDNGNYPESYTLRNGTKGINVRYGIGGLKTLPDTLRFIGNITGYTEKDLIIPEGVEYLNKDFCFYSDQKYDTVVFPASLKSIDIDSFKFSCNKLILKGNPDLTGSGSSGCYSNIKSVEIPENFSAFSVVTLPDTGTYFLTSENEHHLYLSDIQTKNITADMLNGVKSLSIDGGNIETIALPESVKDISFSRMKNLKSIKFTQGIQKVNISECVKLTEIDLPDGVLSLSVSDCNFLKTLNAPDSLIDVYYYGEKSSWYRSLPDGPVYIGKCLAGFKGEMPDNYKLVVPEGIRSICNFVRNEKLTELVLPSTCRYVKGFDYCYNLKKVDLGGTVYIEKDAFEYAPITEIKIGDSCRYIGSSAFASTKLDILKLPDSIEFVGLNNFDAQKVYVSKNMHTAGRYSDLDGIVYETSYDKDNSYSLFNRSQDSSPVIIGYRGTAFEKYAEVMAYSGYTFVDAEKGVYSETNGYVFDQSTGNLTITTNDGMTEWSKQYRRKTESGYSSKIIVEATFPEELEKVKNITIGKDVTTISPFAFACCTKLESITIPATVTLISEGAFFGCTSLKNVNIERNYSTQNDSERLCFSPENGYLLEYNDKIASFENCDSLQSLTIPEGADIPCVYNCPNFKELIIKYDCGDTESEKRYDNLEEKQFVNINSQFTISVPKESAENWRTRFAFYADIINPGSTKIYALSVNGKRFSKDALSIPCGSGTASFNPETNTLTLSSATITKTSNDYFMPLTKTENGVWPSPNVAVRSGLDKLNIVLVGENKIYCPNSEDGFFGEDYPGYIIQGIQTSGDLNISGSGSLSVQTYDYTGIDCGGNLKIDTTSVNFIYKSENFQSGSDMLGYLDASNIEIKNCDLFGTYLWSKGDILLSDTKIDTNGQSIIFGRRFNAKNCDITIKNDFSRNGGAFLINTDETVENNPKFGMTFEDTIAHISVPGMVTNLYSSQIEILGNYGIISGDWDAAKLEIGCITTSTDKNTGIQALNIGEYSFSVQNLNLENDYNGLYNNLYNYKSGYLSLFSGNRPEYRILNAYKLTLKNGNGEEIGGEPFTFKIPVPESLAPEEKLIVYSFKPKENTDDYDYDQSPYALTQIYAPIRNGYISISADDYNKGIFAIVAPESYYIPKPPISGTVISSNTGSRITVTLIDLKENWDFSSTYTTSDPFNFEFDNPPKGTFLLRVEEEEHTTYERMVTVTEGSFIVLNITLRPLGEESTCEVVSSSIPESSENKYGDADGDGTITANDALMILRYTVSIGELSENRLVASDVDGDGQVTANDALSVLRFTVGISDKNKIGEIIAP